MADDTTMTPYRPMDTIWRTDPSDAHLHTEGLCGQFGVRVRRKGFMNHIHTFSYSVDSSSLLQLSSYSLEMNRAKGRLDRHDKA